MIDPALGAYYQVPVHGDGSRSHYVGSVYVPQAHAHLIDDECLHGGKKHCKKDKHWKGHGHKHHEEDDEHLMPPHVVDYYVDAPATDVLHHSVEYIDEHHYEDDHELFSDDHSEFSDDHPHIVFDHDH